MLYTIAHIIQNKAPWLWNMVEKMNAVAFQMLRSSSIAQLNVCCSDGVRLANEDDAHRLQQFFAEHLEDWGYLFCIEEDHPVGEQIFLL